MPGAAAGEFDAQFVQQPRYLVVDVLAAVVGVQAQDLERELRQHFLDHAEQVRLGDRLHAGHHLPLRDAVHGVDVVQALDAVQVTLVDAVDADEAWAALGGGRLAHTDLGVLRGLRFALHHTLVAVARAVAQVVHVPHRELGQPHEARVAEDIALAAQHAGRGRTRQRAHGAVHIGQQRHVRRRVQAGKRPTRRAVVLHQRLAGGPARNQSRDLGAAVAAQALHVGQHHTTLAALEPAVIEAPQHGLDPGVALLVIVLGPLKFQRLRARQHLPRLLHGAHLRFVHVDHHPFDDRCAAPPGCPSASQRRLQTPFQAHSSLESRAWLQAHTSLDKTMRPGKMIAHLIKFNH